MPVPRPRSTQNVYVGRTIDWVTLTFQPRGLECAINPGHLRDFLQKGYYQVSRKRLNDFRFRESVYVELDTVHYKLKVWYMNSKVRVQYSDVMVEFSHTKWEQVLYALLHQYLSFYRGDDYFSLRRVDPHTTGIFLENFHIRSNY